MGKFFTVDVKPDIVVGDVSNVIGSSKSDVDIDAGDLIFDWTEVRVPSGGCVLKSVVAIVNGENGAVAGSLTDYHLIFAESSNGVAPSTMGTVGAAQTDCFDLPDHYVGACVLQSTAATGTLTNPAFHVVYHGNDNSATGGGLPVVFDLKEQVGVKKLYVAGFQLAARHYGTGVLVNGAVTSDTADTITVDGTDARKI